MAEAKWIDRADADENELGQMAVYFERFSRFLHALADKQEDVYKGHEYQQATDALNELVEIEKFLAEQKPRLVNMARAEDSSWSRIGEALGISKQAAQQRFGLPVIPLDRSREIPKRK